MPQFQHTCPREAGTHYCADDYSGELVSTHVPARGGHPHHPRAQPHQQRFNTRARARRAPPANNPQWRGCRVSTHVPARGGHQPIRTHDRQLARFNTRARARRALSRILFILIPLLFQHTCPREAGTVTVVATNRVPGFQHTCPREAGTKCDGDISSFFTVSTHVPARGGHSPRALTASVAPLFQHTCPREAGTRLLPGN